MDTTIRVLPDYLRQLPTVLALLLMVLLLPTFARSAVNNRQQTCPASLGNFTSRDQFAVSLSLLFSSLSADTPSTGFSNTSKGDGANQAYGLALCRGDLVLPSDCKPCVETAVRDLPRVCAGKQSATIWYDDCLVRYSDNNFFGVPTGSPYLTLVSGETAPDAISFKEAVRALAESVARRAAFSAPSVSSIGRYAVEEASRGNSGKLYAMAQCTRDLSGDDCYTCLKDEIRYMSSHDAWTGLRSLGGSCFIRYESAPFYAVQPKQAGVPAPPVTVPHDENNTVTTAASEGKTRKGSTRTIIIIIVVSIIVVTILALAIFIYMRNGRRREKKIPNFGGGAYGDLQSKELMSMDLALLKRATNDFSKENLLGQGGFGPVYKGIIEENEVAVKRLARGSTQGLLELKNEVILVAKLQHRNLARLLGWCLEGEEMLLVYEYLPNGSLDKFLYDPEKRVELDWEARIKIIEGVSRGLQYLHVDSHLTVVHRDLKANNILLDANMDPKISDFGLAKLFNTGHTHQATSRVAGTYGYMAPEYVILGKYSMKSDVYSFGVIVLELVTGHRNSRFHTSGAVDLVNYVLQHWRGGEIKEIIDPTLLGKCSIHELSRCIHIALLCLQEDPSQRPNMSSVVLMFNSQSMSLPHPKDIAWETRTI